MVNTALSKFQDFENIFTLSSSGNCNLVDAEIEINQGDEHEDEHDHEDEHEHEDEDEHDHDEHEEEAHNEFVAHYSFTCGNVKEIDRIDFPYFTTFPNSGELEIQFVSEVGSTSFEVEGDKPFIDLKGKI